jgi:hypothetical protein
MQVGAVEGHRVADQLDDAFALLAHDTLLRTERVTEGLRELENEYGGRSRGSVVPRIR